MDPAHCPSEHPAAPHRPHVVFHERHQDDDAPPFFVHFERDGRSMVLITPATRERYSTAPSPGGD